MKLKLFSILIYLSLFSFLFLSFSCNKSLEQDRFNLMFNYSDSTGFAWTRASISPPKIDSLEIIDSKYPIYLEGKKLYDMFPDHMNLWYLRGILSQQFVFSSPLTKTKQLEISIHNKCMGMDSFKWKIQGQDRHGNIVKESLDINNNGQWEHKSLKIDIDSIETFTVSLIGNGLLSTETANREIPRIYLDRMSIKIDGKDINQINEINNFSSRKKEKLNQKDIYSICTSNSNNLIKEMGLDKKKIIALGETVHGSHEINQTVFQIIKDAILYNNCKLIFTELGLPYSLKLNLFLQGKLPQSEISNIREEMNEYHISKPVFIDFLLWLREYNKTVDRKVVVLGTMDEYEFVRSPLFDYIFVFYNEKNKGVLLPLLSNLHKEELKQAFDFTVNNSEKLKQILNKDEFLFFFYTLKNMYEIKPGTVENYDYLMWLNSNFFISKYLQEGETTCVYAHYGHVTKKEGKQEDLTVPTMGVYFNDYYQNDYSVIGITVGMGGITTREHLSPKFTSINLETPTAESFEGICMHQDNDCFYYPSNKLLYNIYSILNIGNKADPHRKNEIYSNLKINTDGLIFIRQSNPFKDDYTYDKDHLWNKYTKRAAFLKNARNN